MVFDYHPIRKQCETPVTFFATIILFRSLTEKMDTDWKTFFFEYNEINNTEIKTCLLPRINSTLKSWSFYGAQLLLFCSLNILNKIKFRVKEKLDYGNSCGSDAKTSLLRSVIETENARLCLNQSNATETNRDKVTHVFPRFR